MIVILVNFHCIMSLKHEIMDTNTLRCILILVYHILKFILLFLLLGATTDNLPPGVLYRVVATYKYDAEDTDELSFEKGEIISVVPYDDPETQASCY